jgi:selenocysteine-specific elongation factor
VLASVRRELGDPGLVEAVLTLLREDRLILREGTTFRLPEHSASTAGREDAGRLVETVRHREPAPPTVKELAAMGFGQELVRAACADRRLVRISPDIVVTPEFLARAEAVVRERGAPPGMTVSSFREALGTSRKYALPILEFFDARGFTRRQGDVRILGTSD